MLDLHSITRFFCITEKDAQIAVVCNCLRYNIRVMETTTAIEVDDLKRGAVVDVFDRQWIVVADDMGIVRRPILRSACSVDYDGDVVWEEMVSGGCGWSASSAGTWANLGAAGPYDYQSALIEHGVNEAQALSIMGQTTQSLGYRW